MYNEPPANSDKILEVLKEYGARSEARRHNRQERRARDDLFSDLVKKELTKHRPSDVKKKRGIVAFGIAFSILATVSLIILPEPLNWFMASGCLIPFAAPLTRHVMSKYAHNRQTTKQ